MRCLHAHVMCDVTHVTDSPVRNHAYHDVIAGRFARRDFRLELVKCNVLDVMEQQRGHNFITCDTICLRVERNHQALYVTTAPKGDITVRKA